MIADAKFYYGAVLSAIIDFAQKGVHIERLSDYGAGYYLIDHKVPVYIKYSTSRRGPWSFTFRKEHQSSQQALCDFHGECVVVLVCARDGIVAFEHTDLRKILDHNFEEQENIRITRKLNEMYRVSGRDGELDRPISRKSLLDLLDKLCIIDSSK